MALDWLGQLSPTMKQQIALQRALLALQREDEQIRMETMPQAEQPALARGLGAGPGAAVSGGPTYAESHQPQEVSTPTDWEAVWDRKRMLQKETLATALRAAKPTEGYVSGEERSRLYKEKMAAGKEELGVKASEFWTRIEPLDDAGEKVALDACRKYQPDLYKAMIEQGYVDKATGMAVKPEVVKKPMTRDTHVEDGWLYEDVLYDDGTSTHEIIGRAEEVEAEGATISEMVALEKLGMETTEFGERHRADIIKVIGAFPRIGMDTITVDGKDVPVTVEHVNAWLEGYALLNSLFTAKAGEAPPEGEVKMDDVKARYVGRPDLIGDVQEALGILRTEVWDEETERQFHLYGGMLETEPIAEEETKPKFERQKTFWSNWLKTWGKVFKSKGSLNIAGETYEEWKAKKED